MAAAVRGSIVSTGASPAPFRLGGGDGELESDPDCALALLRYLISVSMMRLPNFSMMVTMRSEVYA